MKKIEYTLYYGNHKPEKKTSSLPVLLTENFMSSFFIAGIMPSFHILRDILERSESFLKLDIKDKIYWKPFSLSKKEYDELKPEIIKNRSLFSEKTPAYITNCYEWYLWQYTYKYNVPYDEFKKNRDEHIQVKNELSKAIADNNQEETLYWHLKLIGIATKEADFLDAYINP